MNYLVMVCVLFENPTPLEDRASGKVVLCKGYFRKLGLSLGPNESVETVLPSLVTDGKIDWGETEIDLADFDSLAPEMKANAPEFGKKRMWYRSSRFIFP